MNHKAVLNLRAMFLAQCPFPINDPRRNTLWRRIKRAYNAVPRPLRHPDHLNAALARAMTAFTSAN